MIKSLKIGALTLMFLAGAGIFTSCDPAPPEAFVNSIGLNMIGVPSGSFTMGDLQGEGQFDEVPLHKVELGSSYFISETEITIEQFRQFRADYDGFGSYVPYATGISWNEATEFCRWLSEKEGKTYRLPTEAEWEYACRAGSIKSYSSGSDMPDHETANAWGLKNMHTGPIEWCYDWYGSYPSEDQADPVGVKTGFGKVIRGGLPDDKSLIFDHPVEYYSRSSNRASLAPAFDHFANHEDLSMQAAPARDYDQYSPGLTGLLFDDDALQKPLLQWRVLALDSDELNWFDRDDWSAEWRGYMHAPYTGIVSFEAEASTGIRLIINNDTIIEGWGEGLSRSGHAGLEKGTRYPFVLQYLKDPGDKSFMRLYWSWENQDKHLVSPAALSFNMRDDHDMRMIFNAGLDKKLREPSIGFRIVLAELPDTEYLTVEESFGRLGVRQAEDHIAEGPDQELPYFRKRNLLPMPPDNMEAQHVKAAGVDPYFSWHNHNPALTVCPNGDLLFAFFTATFEDEPEVAYGTTRLRHGADEWDWPSRLLDFADINDVAPLLWNDDGKLWIFFSCLHLDATYPFQWMTSDDNGVTWSEVKYPVFTNRVGPHTPQPIASAFRDSEGTIYMGCDGLGPESFLFASKDNGETWYDTQGRTYARHSVFVQLKDGSIVAYGGKHSDLDGFMPKSHSKDRGKTWTHTKTPFATLGTSQRPAILRLQSGRLFYAGDMQRIDGTQPPGYTEKGSVVAISDDEGETWHMKKLAGGQIHESEMRHMAMQGTTLGYAIVQQSPNGMIQLIGTMTDPILHYEFNEAWILSDEETGEELIMESSATTIENTVSYHEEWPDGTVRLEYEGGIADDGRFLKHGTEKWYYPDGILQYEARFNLGRKTGTESFWNKGGQKLWEWTYTENQSVWKQWWPNGVNKAESTWVNGKCEGMAYTWDNKGKLISEAVFKNGGIEEI